MKRVLLIEDQWPFVAQGILEALGGFTISFVQRGDQALALFLNGSYDLVLLDLRLPGLGGLAILEALKRIEPDLPIIIVSAWDDKKTRARALTLGAEAFFKKPPDWQRLHRRMVETIARREAARLSERKATLTLRSGVRPEFLAKWRRLSKLREQAAKMGLTAPPEVLIEIEDLEQEIAGMEQDLWRGEQGAGGLPG